MFLITTADERYWKTDEKILFLGEWCKRYNRKNFWSKLDNEVLPYHWNDRTRMFRDFQFLAGIYESRLEWLAERLDRLLSEKHSIRYWRIIIGPWLRHFIEVTYDRFLSIESAARCGKVTGTWLLNASPVDWIPKDFPSFLKWYVTDEYNHYIYGRIITFLGGIPWRMVDVPGRPSGIFPTTPVGKTHTLLRNTAKALFAHIIPDSLNRIVLVSSYLSRQDQARLQVALHQFPYFSSRRAVASTAAPDMRLRQALKAEESGSAFDRLMAQLIADQIPSAYLEGHRQARDQSLKAFPGKPALMLTGDAYADDEGFKFWSAHQSERGARLCVSQHGGHDGTGQWSSSEEHELKISDRFYSWGWKSDIHSTDSVPLSGGPLVRAKRALRASPSGGIMWAVMSLPRFAYWMYSVPVGPQMLAYFEDQYRFGRSVSPAVMELLHLRLYPHDYGWDEENRFRDALPQLKTYKGPQSFIEQLNRRRMFVGTYNSTTFLETFTADYPTIIFWNPEHWELRESARPYFDGLRHAEILHDTPESAAAKVNEIYRDPRIWWHQPLVQEARNRFCSRFARVNQDWLREWKTELMQFAAAAHQSS